MPFPQWNLNLLTNLEVVVTPSTTHHSRSAVDSKSTMFALANMRAAECIVQLKLWAIRHHRFVLVDIDGRKTRVASSEPSAHQDGMRQRLIQLGFGVAANSCLHASRPM